MLFLLWKFHLHIFIHCDVTWYRWKLTNNQNAISAQKVNSLKHYTNKQISREKHIKWTTFGLNHHLNNKKVEKSSSCLKRVKNSLERLKLLIRELNYQNIHPRGKVIPLNRWNEVLFSLKKKEYNIFWCCKKIQIRYSANLFFLFLE